jgi:hypothetical protein
LAGHRQSHLQPAKAPGWLASARRFDQVVVATSGEMALMRTVHPLDFARIKRGKDALQAAIINTLVAEYLPHLN